MKQLSLISFVLMSLLGRLAASPTEGGFQLLPSNGNNPNPTRCETNQMCTDYCKTINPGVNVVGTCSNDKSCTCANEGNRVRVRLVEEKPPADTQWVPQVLNCNGSEYTLVICRAFCKSLSYGGGYCNTRQLTCVCSGVHPAVVQEAPIPAIFNFYLDKIPTPEKTSPKPSMLQEWTPIKTSTNAGNQFSNQYSGNPYNNQPFQYSNSQQQYSASNTNNAVQQSSSPSGLNQHPQQQGLYELPSNYWQWQHQYPQEYFQQHFANSAQSVSTSVSAESASTSSGNNSTNANVTVVNSEPDPSRVPVSSTDAAVASSKNPSSPRRKRSAGSSYSNAFSKKQA